MFLHHYLLVFFLVSSGALRRAQGAQWASEPLTAIPLAFRSPYMNIWNPTHDKNGTEYDSIARAWPNVWATNSHVGWAGAVKVDKGTPYQWLGNGISGHLSETVSGSTQMSPTQTTLKAIAGPIQLTITFLSPIEPNDLVKQSFPFSYFSVDVSSLDGKAHAVQLYSDFTGEIFSTDSTIELVSTTTSKANSIFHTLKRTSPQNFTESSNESEDAELYFGMALNQSPTSWQAGDCTQMRGTFATQGVLKNTIDGDRTRQMKNEIDSWYCLGLAMDLGTITSSPSPTVWGVGVVRDPAIRVSTGKETLTRIPYYRTKYSSADDAVDDFFRDFDGASQRASSLDSKIMGEGAAISPEYADLLAFAARPAFGAMDITIPMTSSTTFNASDIQIFMKDVGRSSQTNAVDTLFSALPAYLYLNSTLAGLLLEPLFHVESTSTYQNTYAASNLGSTYPDVRANTSATLSLSIEASANMIIMALAYARKSGDGTQCQRHYDLLKTWADYLSTNALNTTTFLTSDLAVPVGDTNLALKAIIGVQAMSAINQFLEPQGASSADTASYATQAKSLMQNWKNLAFANGFVKATFGDDTSWSLMYNAYADRLLKTSVISDDIYDALALFYAKQNSSAPTYGFPYDSRLTQARSDFTLLTASSLNNTDVRNAMIGSVWKHAVWTGLLDGWPTSYNAKSGIAVSGTFSPAHGSAFSQLALNLPDQTIRLDTSFKVSSSGPTPGSSGGSGQSTNQGPTASSRKHVVGAAVGGAIGGVIFLALVVVGILWYKRKRSAHSEKAAPNGLIMEPFTPIYSQNMTTSLLSSGGPIIDSKTLTPLRRSADPLRMPESPSSSRTGATSPFSSEATSGLRNEMEELRREVIALRQNQAVITEAPPSYAGDHP